MSPAPYLFPAACVDPLVRTMRSTGPDTVADPSPRSAAAGCWFRNFGSIFSILGMRGRARGPQPELQVELEELFCFHTRR
jgi:hypothetical protein